MPRLAPPSAFARSLPSASLPFFPPLSCLRLSSLFQEASNCCSTFSNLGRKKTMPGRQSRAEDWGRRRATAAAPPRAAGHEEGLGSCNDTTLQPRAYSCPSAGGWAPELAGSGAAGITRRTQRWYHACVAPCWRSRLVMISYLRHSMVPREAEGSGRGPSASLPGPPLCWSPRQQPAAQGRPGSHLWSPDGFSAPGLSLSSTYLHWHRSTR